MQTVKKFHLAVENQQPAVLLAAADGPAGFPKVAATVFPKTKARPRVARNSARFAPYKDRKAAIAGLKSIRRKTDRRGSGGVRRNVEHETPDDFPVMAEPADQGHSVLQVLPLNQKGGSRRQRR
ncbi:MAG: hypothetical protein LBG05_04930 [Treponema sp.]|jgi:transposase-like protein|nr:hypothetical protein [Treponema sp.]